MSVEEKFRVEHDLFKGIEFTDAETAEDAAERACLFVIRNTDQRYIRIDVLRFAEERGAVRWWHHRGVMAEVSVGTDNS